LTINSSVFITICTFLFFVLVFIWAINIQTINKFKRLYNK
jgi:hypothetical protein